MENLAFICHSSLDSVIAHKMVVELEKAGIACWIAPRNIQSGTTYAAAIVQGIKKSNRVIFVFSKSSNKSDAVINEIENANALKIPVIPFKIDNEEYSDSLDYYLKSKQSINAYAKSTDQAIVELIQSVSGNAPGPQLLQPAPLRFKKWLIPAIIVLLSVIVIAVYFTSNRHDTKAATVTKPEDTQITITFLKGTWRNEWAGQASELVKISEDGKYYANGVYSFLISNFEYDKSRNQIKFIKISVADQRVLQNTLTVESNNLLVGTEADYNVKYTKLSD